MKKMYKFIITATSPEAQSIEKVNDLSLAIKIFHANTESGLFDHVDLVDGQTGEVYAHTCGEGEDTTCPTSSSSSCSWIWHGCCTRWRVCPSNPPQTTPVLGWFFACSSRNADEQNSHYNIPPAICQEEILHKNQKLNLL